MSQDAAVNFYTWSVEQSNHQIQALWQRGLVPLEALLISAKIGYQKVLLY